MPKFDPQTMKARVAKHVTLPVLKMANGVPVYVRALGEIYRGEARDVADTKAAAKEPPYLLQVHDLVEDRPAVIVVPTVMRSELERAYGESPIKGKCFEITITKPEGNRKYNLATIVEIEDPFPATAEVAPAKAAVKK